MTKDWKPSQPISEQRATSTIENVKTRLQGMGIAENNELWEMLFDELKGQFEELLQKSEDQEEAKRNKKMAAMKDSVDKFNRSSYRRMSDVFLWNNTPVKLFAWGDHGPLYKTCGDKKVYIEANELYLIYNQGIEKDVDLSHLQRFTAGLQTYEAMQAAIHPEVHRQRAVAASRVAAEMVSGAAGGSASAALPGAPVPGAQSTIDLTALSQQETRRTPVSAQQQTQEVRQAVGGAAMPRFVRQRDSSDTEGDAAANLFGQGRKGKKVCPEDRGR